MAKLPDIGEPISLSEAERVVTETVGNSWGRKFTPYMLDALAQLPKGNAARSAFEAQAQARLQKSIDILDRAKPLAEGVFPSKLEYTGSMSDLQAESVLRRVMYSQLEAMVTDYVIAAAQTLPETNALRTQWQAQVAAKAVAEQAIADGGAQQIAELPSA